MRTRTSRAARRHPRRARHLWPAGPAGAPRHPRVGRVRHDQSGQPKASTCCMRSSGGRSSQAQAGAHERWPGPPPPPHRAARGTRAPRERRRQGRCARIRECVAAPTALRHETAAVLAACSGAQLQSCGDCSSPHRRARGHQAAAVCAGCWGNKKRVRGIRVFRTGLHPFMRNHIRSGLSDHHGRFG